MSNWIAKSLPAQGDVHVDAPLTNMSLAYQQRPNNFVATRAFPVVQVDKQSDKFWKFDRSYWFRDEMQLRGDGTESAGGGFAISTGSYACDVYALHKDYGNQVLSNADAGLALDRAAVQFLALQKLIRLEKQFTTDFFTTSKWTTDITPGTLWDDDASDPFADVETGKETILKSTGEEPNKLILGYPVWKALKQHPEILDRLKYGQTPGSPAQVTEQAVAALFGVEELLITKAIENTAAEGASASYDFIGGKHALLVHVPSAPALMTPAAGYTMAWTGGDGMSGMNGVGDRVKRWWSDDRSAWRYEIEAAFDMNLVSADLGYMIDNVVS